MTRASSEDSELGLWCFGSTGEMLAVFDRKVAKSPEGLRSPGAEGGDGGRSLLDHFLAARAGAVAINLGSSGGLAYTSKKQTPLLPR